MLVKLFAALRKFQYDPSRSFRAWLKTVTQHAWSDFVAARRKDPGQNAASIALIADSAEAQSDLERQLEDAFDRELLEVAMHRIKGRVKPATWDAFHLTAIEGLSGADAAQKLGIAVAHVFVAKHRVQKMLQEEVRDPEGWRGLRSRPESVTDSAFRLAAGLGQLRHEGRVLGRRQALFQDPHQPVQILGKSARHRATAREDLGAIDPVRAGAASPRSDRRGG